jgi:glycosyltransferase domain-containing protein
VANASRRPRLTAILPTRNRTHQVVAQLRLFEAVNFPYPLIVADSSDTLDERLLRAADGVARYRRFPPEMDYYEKTIRVVADITTPFVLTLADKKVAFPHSIDPLLMHLEQRDECVAAVGYVLRFKRHENDFDVYRVSLYAPSIDEGEPLRRLYHLMRRYQVSGFGVFRTEAIAHCAAHASRTRGKIFREMMFMSALALRGGIARLPLIFNLHGAEESLSPLDERHPLHWFLGNPSSFFQHYTAYRDALARLIRDSVAPLPEPANLNRLLDLIHGTWLGRECDTGVINHVARGLLGDEMPPLQTPQDWPGVRPVEHGDLVHVTRDGQRRYIWRRSVLEAEPRAEITVTTAQIDAAEDALEVFFED